MQLGRRPGRVSRLQKLSALPPDQPVPAASSIYDEFGRPASVSPPDPGVPAPPAAPAPRNPAVAAATAITVTIGALEALEPAVELLMRAGACAGRRPPAGSRGGPRCAPDPPGCSTRRRCRSRPGPPDAPVPAGRVAARTSTARSGQGPAGVTAVRSHRAVRSTWCPSGPPPAKCYVSSTGFKAGRKGRGRRSRPAVRRRSADRRLPESARSAVRAAHTRAVRRGGGSRRCGRGWRVGRGVP